MNAWTVAHHAPLSMGFPRQEYWIGLSFSYPEALPDPGIEPGSPADSVVCVACIFCKVTLYQLPCL